MPRLACSLVPAQAVPSAQSSASQEAQSESDSQTTNMGDKMQTFNEDQIEDFKEVFQLFDTKGDGCIQVTIMPANIRM